MIGTDSHKRTHTVVVLDDVGRRIAERTVAATGEGHLGLVAWAGQWPDAAFAGCLFPCPVARKSGAG